MRIISTTFTDFYDSGLKYDTNSDIVFQRNPITYEIKNAPKIVKELHEKYKSYIIRPLYFMENYNNRWSYKSPYRKNGTWFSINDVKLLVVFCGNVFPALRIDIQEETKVTTNYFYDFDSFDNYRQQNGIELTEKNHINNIKNYFDRDNVTVDIDFLIANKITIATLYVNKVLFNNNLSELQFYRVYNPYIAYQELEMWMSGVLSYPQNLMIEVGNEEKIKKHGFDLKYGFRKRPV